MIERIRNITSAWLIALLFLTSSIIYLIASFASHSLAPDSAHLIIFGGMTTYAHGFIHKLLFSLINTNIINELLALLGLALFLIYIAREFTIIGVILDYLTIVLIGSIICLQINPGIACGSTLLLISLGAIGIVLGFQANLQKSKSTIQLIGLFLIIIGCIIQFNVIILIIGLIIGTIWSVADVVLQNYVDTNF